MGKAVISRDKTGGGLFYHVRLIRHSTADEDNLIFWHEASGNAESGHITTTAEDDARELAKDFEQLPRALSDARSHAERKFKTKRKGELAFNMIKGNPVAYGLVVKASGIGVEKWIGTPERVENAISQRMEKYAQDMLS